MGNAAFREIASIEQVPARAVAGQTFAVDAYNWLYSYMAGIGYWMDEDVYTTADGTEVLNLVACLRGLPTLLEHDITPIFVFDGSADERKAAEQQRRREARKDAESRLEVAREAGDTDAVKRLRARTQRLTPTVQRTTRELLSLLGIPHVDAPGAGEAQAAKLVRDGHADAVLSDDYDSLVFGSPITIRNFSGDGAPERMDFAATLETRGFTHRQLVDFALLIGTDYNDGVYGVGPKRGLAGLEKHGDVETMLDGRNAEIADLDALRRLFLEPNVADVEPTATGVPDYEAVRQFAVGEWGVDAEQVEAEIARFRAVR